MISWLCLHPPSLWRLGQRKITLMFGVLLINETMTRIFPSRGGRGGTLIFKIFGGFKKNIFRVKRFCGYFLGSSHKLTFFCFVYFFNWGGGGGGGGTGGSFLLTLGSFLETNVQNGKFFGGC